MLTLAGVYLYFSAMMTTGTSDGSAVTVEVKENGHPHSNGDSEDAANKPLESPNVQTPPKDDKQEETEDVETGKLLLAFEKPF